jgi:hypothetical protein
MLVSLLKACWVQWSSQYVSFYELHSQEKMAVIRQFMYCKYQELDIGSRRKCGKTLNVLPWMI